MDTLNKYFYTASSGSVFYRKYLDYFYDRRNVASFLADFLTRHGIPRCSCTVDAEKLRVKPNKTILKKFGNQLCKYPEKNGYAFRKNSPVGYAWTEEQKDKGLKYLSAPCVPAFFQTQMNGWYYTFLFHDEVYIHLEADRKVNELPECFNRISASLYYAAYEAIETKNEQNIRKHKKSADAEKKEKLSHYIRSLAKAEKQKGSKESIREIESRIINTIESIIKISA